MQEELLKELQAFMDKAKEAGFEIKVIEQKNYQLTVAEIKKPDEKTV